MNAPRSTSGVASITDAYPTRIMLGLVTSLSLLILLAHLPVQSSVSRVGWSTRSSVDRILLSDLETEQPSEESPAETSEHAPPATTLQFPRPGNTGTSSSANESRTAPPQETDASARPSNARSVATLGTSDRRPQIAGGLGSLYLNIDYPAKARRKGIEGRLTLTFTVGTDGSVSDIAVAEPLHPLCDSAAVEGLRAVKFVPAKHNGEAIPIRMELPIRFELAAMSNTAQLNDPGR